MNKQKGFFFFKSTKSNNNKRRITKPEIAITLVGVLVIALAIFFFQFISTLSEQARTRDELISDVRFQLSVAHLWSEQLLQDDPTLNFERDVLLKIDNAQQIVEELLQGNSSGTNRLEPASTGTFRANLLEMTTKIDQFKQVTIERMNLKKAGAPVASINQSQDLLFSQILELVQKEEDLTEQAKEQSQQLEDLFRIGLIVAIGALFGVLLIVIYHSRRSLEVQAGAALKLASLVEFSDDAIFSKNLEGVIESWNGGGPNNSLATLPRKLSAALPTCSFQATIQEN